MPSPDSARINNVKSEAPVAHIAGPFDDPFEHWLNDDLLLDPRVQEFFRRHHPTYAPIFDWAELRELFGNFNLLAQRARAHSRRTGVAAVLAGFSSLCVTAMVPVAENVADSMSIVPLQLTATLGMSAAFLAILSIVMGYTQTLRGQVKKDWLKNRFWAERIRQFHFQLILNNPAAVLDAARGDPHLSAWLDLRTRALDQFKHDYLYGVEDKIHHFDDDDAEEHPWLCEDWAHPAKTPAASPELDQLLGILEQQRFGIQERYTARKLRPGWYSPVTRTDWVLQLSDTLSALLLAATAAVGIGLMLAFRYGVVNNFLLTAAVVGSLCSASIVAMRALKEGLLFSADAERYRWYLAALRSLHQRYKRADHETKVMLLRELEHCSYQELRRFTLTAKSARFVM